jgi:hypothetical protein
MISKLLLPIFTLLLALRPSAQAATLDPCIQNVLKAVLKDNHNYALPDKDILLRQSTQQLVDFILSSHHLPTLSSDQTMFRRLKRLQKDPNFIKLFKEHREAWRKYEELSTSPAKNTALETIAYRKQYGELPNKITNRALLEENSKYEKDAAFVETLKQDPDTWKLYQKMPGASLAKESPAQPVKISAAKQAALDVIQFIDEHKRLPAYRWVHKDNGPTSDHSFFRLYLRMQSHRDNPEFIQTLRENPAAWKVFQDAKATAALKQFPAPVATAIELSQYFRNPDSAKQLLDFQSRYLFQKWRSHRNNPEFIDFMKRDPEVWKHYEEAQANAAKQAALDYIAYIPKRRTYPAGYVLSGLHLKVDAYKTHPEFIKILSENHIGRVELQKLKMTPVEAAIDQVMTFMARTGKLPEAAIDHTEYSQIYLFRNDPKFIEAMKQDPETWELFQSFDPNK